MCHRWAFLSLLVGLSHGLLLPQASSVNSSGASIRIPRQIIFTGHEERLQDMPRPVQNRVKAILDMNPGLKMRWLGDRACQKYMMKYFDNTLQYRFIEHRDETHGPSRGVVCKMAVLHREGGFYADLDLEPSYPLEDLVHKKTTFMAVQGVNGGMMDSLIAAAPHNEVLGEALRHIDLWARGHRPTANATHRALGMGSVTLIRGLMTAVEHKCPNQIQQKLTGCGHLGSHEKSMKGCHLADEHLWQCGKQQFQIYKEGVISCKKVSAECPKNRHYALQYKKTEAQRSHLLTSIFRVEEGGKETEAQRSHLLPSIFRAEEGGKETTVVGWPHHWTCQNRGCGACVKAQCFLNPW